MTRIERILPAALAVAIVSISIAAAALAAGTAPAPLPAFALTAPDGSAASSSALTIPGNWLLVYVRPGSSFGDALLIELGKLGQTSPSVGNDRIIFVVGGVAVADAQTYLKKFPQFKSAGWYADPGLAGIKALVLPGTPAVLGMSNGDRRWNLVGTLPDATVLRSILRSWAQKTN